MRRPRMPQHRAIVALFAIATIGCYTRAPIEPPRGSNAFSGADHIRVTLNDGEQRSVWYPTMSGDTAIEGITDKFVVAATLSIQIPLRDVRTVERVKPSHAKRIGLMVFVGAAAVVLIGFGLRARGPLTVC